METILDDVKNHLGVPISNKCFDNDLKNDIEAAIYSVNTLGVFDGATFNINENTTWEDIFGDVINSVPIIKKYVCLKVRLLFDPPANGTLTKTITDQISEYAYNINLACDNTDQSDYAKEGK